MEYFRPEILEEESRLINKIIFSRREAVTNNVNGENAFSNLEHNINHANNTSYLSNQIRRRKDVLKSLEQHLITKITDFNNL